MKQFFLCLLLFIIYLGTTQSNAQTTDSLINFNYNDTVIPIIQYEMKANILPLMIPFYNDRYGSNIEYYPKYLLSLLVPFKNGKIPLRFQLSFTPNYYQKVMDRHYPASYLIDVGDSTLTYLNKTLKSNGIGFSIGYERRLKSSYGQISWGIDITSGIIFVNSENTILEYANPQKDTLGAGQIRWGIKTISNNKIQTQLYKVGFCPFFGWKTNFINNTQIGCQLGIEVCYLFGNDIITNNEYQLKKQKFSILTFSDYYLNEISLSYLF